MIRGPVLAVLMMFIPSVPVAQSPCIASQYTVLKIANGSGGYVRWPSCKTIIYSIDTFNGPSGSSSEIASAFSAWDALSDLYTFSQEICVDAWDGCGSVYFEMDSWTGETDAFGDTQQILTSDGRFMFGFVIRFNMVDYPNWTTNCTAGQADVQTVALHEVGHALGLWHLDEYSVNCPTVMQPWLTNLPCRDQLLAWDIDTISDIYTSTFANFSGSSAQLGLIASTGACDFNSAATVTDFCVLNGVATWSVKHEWQTKEYVIEGCMSPRGPGTELLSDRPGLGNHAVRLETSFPFVRLVEVESSGRREFRSFWQLRKTQAAQTESFETRASTPIGRTAPERFPTVRTFPSALPSAAASTSNPAVVIYTVPDLVTAVNDEVVPFWESKGLVVEVVNVGSFPPAAELEAIKASISSFASSGTKYFHLIGEWEDSFPPELWETSSYWQSKYDSYRKVGVIPATSKSVPSIPTYRYLDNERGAENTARTVPYVYTDQWYADVDLDDIPDVVVTRWPFSEPAEVVSAAARLPLADVTHPYQLATFLVGDALPNGPGSIEITTSMVNDLKTTLQELNDTAVATLIQESNYPDYIERNQQTASHLNAYRPDLIVGLGTYSNGLHPMQFFRKEFYPPPPTGWSMSMLAPDFFTRMVIAASCHSAAWVPSGPDHDCDSDPPCTGVCDDFLSNDGPGSLAWIGPTTGTLQGGNYVVARLIIEELLKNPYRPMAESWLIAIQRAYSIASPAYVPTLMSYAFLGDPISPYRAVPDCEIQARLRRSNGSEAMMPASFAIACPQGDRDKVVIEVRLNRQGVISTIPADALTLSQPTASSLAFYPHLATITADSIPTFKAEPTFTEGYYQTTFTVRTSGGCGIDSALVSLFGIPLGYAHVNIKSPDATLVGVSHGKVDLFDFSVFGESYTSPPKPYNSCVDFIPTISEIVLNDFAEFSAHWNHSVPGQASAVQLTPRAAGIVLLHFEESHPLLGEHILRAKVSLEGVSPFEAAVFALRNDNPKLQFSGWVESNEFGGETMCTETVRDGHTEVFIGVLDEAADNADVVLGTAEFRVVSEQQLTLGDSDLALVTADLLSSNEQRNVLALSSLDVRRTVAPVSYRTELGQNFPNPFNPTTTISFSLAHPADVLLSIYDVRGALVRTVVNERREQGIHRTTWDGMNSSGQRVASGVYFYRLVAGPFIDTKKMTILK